MDGTAKIRMDDDASGPGKTTAADFPSACENTSSNGLLEALIHISRHHGRMANKAELIRGLPMTPEGLSLSRIEEAAHRLGLVVRIEQREVAKIPVVTLPVIAMLEGEQAVVVEKIDRRKDTATVFAADIPGGSRPVKLSDLAGPKMALVIFVNSVGKTATEEIASDTPKDWFWSAVRRFWPNYLQVVIAAFIGNMLGLASPLFIMNVYDRVIPNLAIPTLWVLTIGVLIAFLFDFVLKMVRMQIVDETGRRVDMAVAGRLFDHFLRIKLAGRPASTGAVANQVRDLDSVRDALTSSSVIAMTDLLFIGIFVWVMWYLVGPLAFVPALAVPVVVAVTSLVQIPLSRALAESQNDAARRQSVLVETISSLETIKVTGGESWFRRAWDRAVAAASRSTTKARYWANTAASFTGVVFQLVSIVIVVWGVFLVLDGQITVGALIAANILAGRVLSPLNNISQTLSRLLHARTAMRSLNALMTTQAESGVVARSIATPDNLEIAFQNVTLAYPENKIPALEDVSFSVRSGERVGIIGRVGSGKSTLVRILSGLYEPQSGTYLLGGVDTRQFSPADLRTTVGLCLQDAELFSGTLRDNILIGAPYASAQDLERAVHLAGVDFFSSRHPDGLDMHIEERGRSLSGGQRQSVALARCLIRSPKILCLDEPTAYLDIMSERQLCSRLREIADTGITLFIATHRDGPLELVDRLLLLDRGKLLMDGPKDEVVARLKAGAQNNAPPAPPFSGGTHGQGG
ncbi:MAG: type I secretion system permease/ATPase [Roseibium sp.]|uniref:type I secretion system permease/ATPase n=1 Tax=Roseibium sp. TaxID=1936156 RepID=UPI0026109478|nr:type I secretion system permease/ATPase [Roseibium sp.]MCV0427667.1 type I secretion system permease/ATPase [Roseibium sp.]